MKKYLIGSLFVIGAAYFIISGPANEAIVAKLERKKSIASNVSNDNSDEEKSPAKESNLSEAFELGQQAFSNASSRNYQTIYLDLESDPPYTDYLNNGEFLNLFIHSLSNLDRKQSYFYMLHSFSNCAIQQFSDSQNLVEKINNASSADLNFYLGIKAATEKSLSELKEDCQQIQDQFALNKTELESNLLRLLNLNNMKDLNSKSKAFGNRIDKVMEFLGIKLNDDTLIYTRLLDAEENSSEQEQQAETRRVVDYLADNPKYYLNKMWCMESCKQRMGQQLYSQYIRNGAHLGSYSTLFEYISNLRANGLYKEELAWTKYGKKLNRLGCDSTFIINHDMSYNRTIEHYTEQLSEKELEEANTLYEQLLETHLNRARKIIGC